MSFRNPRTGRLIKKGGPTYRRLVRQGIRPTKVRKRRCPRGQIVRAGYVRKAYTRKDGRRVKRAVVKAKCVMDRGAKGKGPKLLPKLKRGVLGVYGYDDVRNMSQRARRLALDRAVRAIGQKEGSRHAGALKVFRRLNAVWIFNRDTNPVVGSIFLKDRNYVRDKYM